MFSKGLCQRHWRACYGKPLQRQAIKKRAQRLAPVSAKRAQQLAQYRRLRDGYLKKHPKREIGVAGCTGVATEVHHTAGRENGRLLVVEDFKATCRACHRWATDNSAEAIALGHSKSRTR